MKSFKQYLIESSESFYSNETKNKEYSKLEALLKKHHVQPKPEFAPSITPNEVLGLLSAEERKKHEYPADIIRHHTYTWPGYDEAIHHLTGMSHAVNYAAARYPPKIVGPGDSKIYRAVRPISERSRKQIQEMITHARAEVFVKHATMLAALSDVDQEIDEDQYEQYRRLHYDPEISKQVRSIQDKFDHTVEDMSAEILRKMSHRHNTYFRSILPPYEHQTRGPSLRDKITTHITDRLEDEDMYTPLEGFSVIVGSLPEEIKHPDYQFTQPEVL